MDAGHFSPTFRLLLRELSPCLAQWDGHIVSHLQLVRGHAAIAQESYSGKLKNLCKARTIVLRVELANLMCMPSSARKFDMHSEPVSVDIKTPKLDLTFLLAARYHDEAW